MDLQTKNKIPVEYQEAFELGLFGNKLPALNLVFNLLEEKLHLFGLAWSVAIFFEDSLGADRWLRRASKILEDHRNSIEKTIEEEALYMIESYMRIRSRENIINYTIPDPLLKIKQLIAKLSSLIVDNIRDEKSTWTRFLKAILLVDLHVMMDTQLDSEDFETLIDDLIEYDPSNEYYWYLKGVMEPYSDGFKKALELNPKLALVYFQQAKEDLQCGSIEDAISQLDKAIVICPRFADAHLEKASALQQMSQNGEKAEIIKHMDIGIELDPENADYYYKKGYFLVDLNEFEDAAKSLNKALEIEPTYGGAYNQLAYIHISQNQFAAAIRAYLNAIKLNSDVKQNFANITRAMSNLDDNESNAINEEIIQCIGSMAPSDNNVLSVVDFMEIRGEDESALKFLEKAQNPSPKILYNMGMVLKRLGRYQEAIEKLQKVLDVVTNPALQAPAYEAIGWIYANKLQDPDTGLKYITKSMKLSKRYPTGVMFSVRDPTDPEAGEFIISLK